MIFVFRLQSILTIVKSVKSFRKNYSVWDPLSLDLIFGFRRRQSLSKREKKVPPSKRNKNEKSSEKRKSSLLPQTSPFFVDYWASTSNLISLKYQLYKVLLTKTYAGFLLSQKMVKFRRFSDIFWIVNSLFDCLLRCNADNISTVNVKLSQKF